MKKYGKKIFALLLAIVLVLSFAACSKGSSEKDEYVSYDDGLDYSSSISKKIASNNSTTESSSSLAESALAGKNVKLVYKASLSLQTQNFEESYDTVVEIVKEYNGYFESSEVSNGSYYETYISKNSYISKYGNMVVRIPTENYNDFLTKVGDSIYVSSKSETVENIGQSYYETETHIATLKVEITRLQELMAKAENMSDIITIEKALSEAENELQQYQTTLAGYDSLIEYSTITIKLNQVATYSGSEETFWEKIVSSFASGWASFVSFWEDFVLWLIENLFVIIILVVLIILCRKFKWLSKLWNKIFKKKENKENKAN